MKIKAITLVVGVTAMAVYGPVALGEHHHGSMHGKYHTTLNEKLNLNEQQQQLLAASRQQSMASKERKRELRRQLRGIVHSDRYDAAAVERIADQMAEVARETIIQHGATMNEFYQSLTPDQRATLETIEQHRSARKASYRNNPD